MDNILDYINGMQGSDDSGSPNAFYNDLVYRGGVQGAQPIPNYTGDPAQYMPLAMGQRMGSAPPRIERWGQASPVPRGGMALPRVPNGMGGPGVNLGPTVPSGMDTNTMNQYLAPYGQQMPTQINPNVIFPNSGAFARHPMLTSMLEGGIMGAANFQGGDTIGDNISGIARSIMGTQAERRQNISNQIMAPISMAEQMAEVQKNIDAHNLSRAHQAYFNAMGDYHKGLIANQQDRITAQNNRADERAAATRPVPDGFGGAMIFDPESETWKHSDFGIAAKNPIDGLVAATNKRLTDAGEQPMTPEQEAHYRARLNAIGVDKPRPKGSAAGGKVAPEDASALRQATDNFKQADGQYKEFFTQNGRFALRANPALQQQATSLTQARDQAARHLSQTQKAYNHKYPSNIGNAPDNAPAPSGVGALVDKYK